MRRRRTEGDHWVGTGNVGLVVGGRDFGLHAEFNGRLPESLEQRSDMVRHVLEGLSWLLSI